MTSGKNVTRRQGRGSHQVFAGARGEAFLNTSEKRVSGGPEWRPFKTGRKKDIDFAVFPFRLFVLTTRKGWR
ncbi:hypothetical protein [Paraburkholderia sp. UYCP14C]|uniref:hypothetical protein n=1 Tax=Paraburkholderia sp. UYCP14C TaxID=2511130 RepID=UPI001459FF39|nr:hypothetical protein [Paraburkholderia sp. UYCP14C]